MEKRLPMYEARRLKMLHVLQTQITELDAKRRFIQAILDERLILQKRSDEEIVENMKSCNIPPLSCPEKPDHYDSYDYVLRMRIDRLKQSAIVELDHQIEEKQGEIEHLESQTASSLWLSDLEEFKEAWIHYSASRVANETSSSESGDKKVQRKRKPSLMRK